MGFARMLGAAALMAAALTFAAGADTPAEICAKTVCREGGAKLTVFFDKERSTKLDVTRSPYVKDGAILIFPGETLAFELPFDGDKIGEPKFLGTYQPDFPMLRDPAGPALPKLDKSKLAPNTLVLSYGQMDGRGKGGPSMMLTLTQNLPMTVKLDAFMTVLRPDSSETVQAYTSTCPLMPNRNSFENWPNALGPMILSNFRFQASGTAMVCD